jgi:hypothetical protein
LEVYLHLGFALFPYGQSSKKPLNQHGYSLKYLEDGGPTLKIEQVNEWHKQFPGCAWGVATTAERGVLDIDPRHGGDRILAEWEAQHGKLPPTWAVETGGGGCHKYLTFPPGTRSREMGGNALGIKAIDGGVILPPSRLSLPGHLGTPYRWQVKPWELEIGVAPAWLLEKFQKHPKPNTSPKSTADEWVVQAPPFDLLTHPGASKSRGEKRRPTLNQLVGVHLDRGDSKMSIEAMVRAWASRCEPPLTEDEWRKHVDGLWDKEEQKRHERRTASLPHQAPATTSEQTKGGTDGGEIVRSLATPQEQHHGGEKGGVKRSHLAHPQLALSPDAYHGLFGKMLAAIEPQTEGHPAAVLLGWLTCFGNIVGRGAWFQVGARSHYPCLYVGNVGETSAAKADAWSIVLYPFRLVEPAWALGCIANGIGSGEGLLERVADEQRLMTLDKSGQSVEKIIPGASDKRCLIRLSELSRCFKAQRRENSLLSEHLREMWDGEPVHVLNRQHNALTSSGYALSLFGDITPKALVKALATGTESFDGFANRFLWVKVRSPLSLPDAGDMSVIQPFLTPLSEALTYAKSAGQLKRDEGASRLWHKVYDDLKTSGDHIPHTDRARPFSVRLSMLYALADKSQVIREVHLRAALSVLDYCRESARLLFMEEDESRRKPETKDDPFWLKVLNVIVAHPGINRRSLHESFGGHLKADELTEALDYLLANRLAYRQTIPSGGRPAECWFPAKREPDDRDYTPSFPPPGGTTASNQTKPEPQAEFDSSLASPTQEKGRGEGGGGVKEQPEAVAPFRASVKIDCLADAPLAADARTEPLASDEWVVKPDPEPAAKEWL